MKHPKELIARIQSEMQKKIIGQEMLVRDLLITLFSGGHILLEGAPGLAKTLSVDTLSKIISADFQRIQFTPDLLPSDLIGAKMYNPDTKKFSVKKWPIFSNIVLADEINRAPSKVQSALLEAMAERQVTIGDTTYMLDAPFMVLATQNPIEQDGTYNLPEAQLDRFLLKTVIDYPNKEEEIQIMQKNTRGEEVTIEAVLHPKDIAAIQKQATDIHVQDAIYEYVRDIVFYSREQEVTQKYLAYGASPRASIALIKTAKVLALMEGRDFVIPEDIKMMAYPVLRHRMLLSFEAMAEGVSSDEIIDQILANVKMR